MNAVKNREVKIFVETITKIKIEKRHLPDLFRHPLHRANQERSRYKTAKSTGFLRWSLGILLWLYCGLAIAQVTNNNIAERIELKLNEPAHSNTHHASVEWNCINKALTNKCLVYHNDQWFYFTPPENGTYYINIASQNCKKRLGVQLIVIEGNPCEIKEYTIKRCINKIHQDDVFITLDELKGNTQYLLNVDGFLEDFCEFDITFSDKPDGLPESRSSRHALELKTETKDRLVTLNWRAGLDWVDRVEQFEVYRVKSGELKSVRISKQTVRRNALGLFEENYTYTDTLQQDGQYEYTILMEDKDTYNRTLLDRVQVRHAFIQTYLAEVPLNFAVPGLLSIDVIDAERKTIVKTISHDYQRPATLSIDLSFQVKYVSRRFWIRVRQPVTRQEKVFAFEAIDGALHLVGQ